MKNKKLRIVSLLIAAIMMMSLSGMALAYEDEEIADNIIEMVVTPEMPALPPVYGNDDAYVWVLDSLLEQQFNALVTGEKVQPSDLYLGEECDTYVLFLDYRVEMAVLLNVLYSNYKLDIEADSIRTLGQFTYIDATVDIFFEYTNGLWGGQSNVKYSLVVDESFISPKIVSIETTEISYVEYLEKLSEKTDYVRSRDVTISKETAAAIVHDDLAVFALQVEQAQEMHLANAHLLEQEDIASPLVGAEGIVPFNTTFSYSNTLGVQYAEKYWNNRNTAFRASSPNCTNFVSQCIWAAYGGWSTSDSHATIVANIAARRRMMPSTTLSNWFGHNNGAGTPWESVVGLWNLATSNPATGPRATGSNNNALYTALIPGNISTGNVLQFRNGSSGNYTHSVFVVGFTSPPSYSNIMIAQNSSDVRRSLMETINANGGANCHMRRLSFQSAVFPS